MKTLIRKILREAAQIPSDAPEWVKNFHNFSKEERIKDIEKRNDSIVKVLPSITEFFTDKFGDTLDKIVIDTRGVHYGNENYSTTSWVLKFHFDEGKDLFPRNKIYREITRDLRNFFNIDLEYYGVPLQLEFYVKKWEKV